jgi:YD repeat-containing protein
MKLKFWMMPLAAIMFFASCNNDGTKTDTDDTVATTTTTTTDNMASTSGDVVVPDNTRTTFTGKYPAATNVTWRRYDPNVVPIDWEWSGWTTLDTGDYVASFNVDGSDYWVWYDESGNWVGEVSTVSPSSVPAAVSNAIKSKYSGYTIVSVDRENDKDRTAYEIELDKNGEKMTVLVDENGNVLKSKTAAGKTKVDQ